MGCPAKICRERPPIGSPMREIASDATEIENEHRREKNGAWNPGLSPRPRKRDRREPGQGHCRRHFVEHRVVDGMSLLEYLHHEDPTESPTHQKTKSGIPHREYGPDHDESQEDCVRWPERLPIGFSETEERGDPRRARPSNRRWLRKPGSSKCGHENRPPWQVGDGEGDEKYGKRP